MKSKKYMFYFAVILVLIFVLACTNETNVKKTERINVEKTSDEKIITLNMQGHWKGEDLRENYVTETIKEFEIKNSDVKVNLKWNADFPNGRKGSLDATLNQFKTGDIDWDIIWLEPFYYQEIALELGQDWGQKNLVDFETLPGFKETQKDFIINDPQYRNHMNGIITGPYIEGFYQPFFYNKELTEMMGIQIKDKDMTFEDLLGYFKAVHDYNEEHGTNIPILYDSGDYKGGIGYAPSTWNIFQSLFRSEFSDLEELKSTEPSEKKLAVLRKVLGSLEELSKYDPLIEGWENLPWFDTRYYVLENEAVFTAAGASWMYSHWHGIDAKKTAKMVPVEMPMYQEVNHYIGGYNPMFAVSKNSPNVDKATELLMEFATSKDAEKWTRYAKAPSGIKGGISEAGTTSAEVTPFDTFIIYISDKYGGNLYDSKTVDYILGEKYKDITVQFSMSLGAVMDGKMTAEEAYKKILEDMEQFK